MWKFTIWDIDSGGSFTDIDEPVGWDGITLRLRRDRDWHGFFEFMDDEISTLQFDGEGRDILANAFEDRGIEARVVLIIQYLCSGTTYDLLWTGFFDFTTYKFVCSDRCYIEINLVAEDCMKKLRSRYDQKVDLKSLQTFDGSTLPSYDDLGFNLTMHSQNLTQVNDWEIENNGFNYTHDCALERAVPSTLYFAFPWLQNLTEIDTSDAMEFIYCHNNALTDSNDDLLSPVGEMLKLYDGIINVDLGSRLSCASILDVSVDMAGYIQIASADTLSFDANIFLSVCRQNDQTTIPIATLQSGLGCSGCTHNTETIAVSYTGSLSLFPGDRLYLMLVITNARYTTGSIGGSAGPFNLVIQIDSAHLHIQAKSFCEPTQTKVFMVNEALSRATESITDDCLRVYSDYYGRENAQPYTSSVNGCGSYRTITNGLLIRNADMLDGDPPPMPVSLKELFDGLNAIDNIGMGLETDTHRPGGYKQLRIEPYQYFYQHDVIFTADHVAELEIEVQENKYISKFLCGYDTWETERINGAHDIHTSREYRTSLSQVRNTLDRTCKFVASGYTIEITRREFGRSTRDWRYDNNIFIISIVRLTSPDGPYYYPEIGGGGMALDHMPEASIYNVSISPARNALRHLNTILQSYTDLMGKLFFTAGQGNLVAESKRNSGSICPIENVMLAENADIDLSLLINALDFLPVYLNQLVKFDYPMSYEQFKTIQANPYGLIEYSCANGPMRSGWIENLKYSPEKGMASFEIKPRYFQ